MAFRIEPERYNRAFSFRIDEPHFDNLMGRMKLSIKQLPLIFTTIFGVTILAGSPSQSCAQEPSRFSELKNLFKRDDDTLVEAGQAPCGPGGLCVLPNGDYIISCHQFFDPVYRVMRMKRDGSWEPFPNIEMNVPGGVSAPGKQLDSVVGIVCDSKGVVWMLDNGRRTEQPPKLVAWDTKKNRLRASLPISAVVRTSFLKNLVLDPNHPIIYISDPANGEEAAIIVVDITTGLSRRVLQGHESVKPQAGLEIQLDGQPVVVKRADGEAVSLLAGVSPIALDKKGTWLYYGPRNGRTLFKIRTDLLRNESLSPDSLQAQFKGVSQKPICDSMAIDSRSNIYFTDIARGSIDYVTSDDEYLDLRILVRDPRIIWPGGIVYADDRLHFFSNQLHRTKIFTGEKNAFVPPFHIFELKPLRSGLRFGN